MNMKSISFFVMVFIIFLFFSCGNNENQSEHSNTEETDSQNVASTESKIAKDLVMNGMNTLFSDYDEEGAKKYFAEDYIQHNPQIPTGIEPILGFLKPLKEAGTTFENHRILQDGDFVIMHNTYTNAEAFGAKDMVTFDIFRVENGKIVEHWDCLQPFDPEAKNKSGRTVIDGSTEITDLDKTEENKKLVEDFYRKVFVEGKKEAADNYLSEKVYIQHSAAGKDGPESFKAFLDFYITEEYTPAKIHRVLGEGNFVLVQAESEEDGKASASYDLFRVEDGKIVEHWDILQEIPEKMAHENGIF